MPHGGPENLKKSRAKKFVNSNKSKKNFLTVFNFFREINLLEQTRLPGPWVPGPGSRIIVGLKMIIKPNLTYPNLT